MDRRDRTLPERSPHLNCHFGFNADSPGYRRTPAHRATAGGCKGGAGWDRGLGSAGVLERSSQGVKYLLISTLAASGLTSTISLRLAHEEQGTVSRGPGRRRTAGGAAETNKGPIVAAWLEGWRDLRPQGSERGVWLMWLIRISQG